MPNKKNKELLHGQALALQWVSFALQKITEDTKVDGAKTQLLLGDAKTINNGNGLKTLSLGCSYVVNFLLPFTIELSLKALLTKENVTLKNSHDLLYLYNKLPEPIKESVNFQYKELIGVAENQSIQELLDAHRNDFIFWRYLENPEQIKRDEVEMQLAISAILDIYNLPQHPH